MPIENSLNESEKSKPQEINEKQQSAEMRALAPEVLGGTEARSPKTRESIPQILPQLAFSGESKEDTGGDNLERQVKIAAESGRNAGTEVWIERVRKSDKELSSEEKIELSARVKEAGLRTKEEMLEHLKKSGEEWGISPAEIQRKLEERAKTFEKSAQMAQSIAAGQVQDLTKLMSKAESEAPDLKLVSKILKDAGLNIVAEQDRQGRLLISHPGDETAVMVDRQGKADLVGIKGRQYDFQASFVNPNPQEELSGIIARAAKRYLYLESKIIKEMPEIYPQKHLPEAGKPWSNPDAIKNPGEK
ncbi:MAG: hypothetical protein K2X27_01835 [Candidatus Obscuribacterales bacterium]|nr:hypothetical protein [Candidatus Obscuribacterales bacterium]